MSKCKCKKRAKKNDRIVVQLATTTRDAIGDPVDTWADIATRWAKVVPLNGREFQLANQATAEVSHRVELSRSASLSLTPHHRFKWTDDFGDTHLLGITAIITPVDGNPREMNVMAKEVI